MQQVNKQRSQGNSYGSNNRSGGYRNGSNNSHGYRGNSSKSSGYGGGYRGNSNNSSSYSGNRNRGRRSYFSTNKISQDMYISKAQEVELESPYVATKTFNDFNINHQLKANIIGRDYKNPTKVQDLSIPAILEGRDIVALASTGSGKTAAFLIPMINKVLEDRTQRILIVTPTRELASQIRSELRLFTEGLHINSVLVIGGASMRDQISKLKLKPHFIIATPGRLIDLNRRNHIDLASFHNVILDEVDQMLDMGFLEDMRLIVAKLGKPRQSMFFSATMSTKEQEIANSLLVNPVHVKTEKQSPIKNVEQKIIKFSSKADKINTLHELLVKEDFVKVLIFSKTKRGADDITFELQKRGLTVDSLHGDKSQAKRSRILNSFRTNELKILIATDVASRGIDVKDISHVINYDEPATYKDYIHRIGRTGRIGKKGIALTFVS